MDDFTIALDEAKVDNDNFKAILQRLQHLHPSDAAKTLENVVARALDEITGAAPSVWKRMGLILLYLTTTVRRGGPQLCEAHASLLGHAQKALKIISEFAESQSVGANMAGQSAPNAMAEQERERRRQEERAAWDRADAIGLELVAEEAAEKAAAAAAAGAKVKRSGKKKAAAKPTPAAPAPAVSAPARKRKHGADGASKEAAAAASGAAAAAKKSLECEDQEEEDEAAEEAEEDAKAKAEPSLFQFRPRSAPPLRAASKTNGCSCGGSHGSTDGMVACGAHPEPESDNEMTAQGFMDLAAWFEEHQVRPLLCSKPARASAPRSALPPSDPRGSLSSGATGRTSRVRCSDADEWDVRATEGRRRQAAQPERNDGGSSSRCSAQDSSLSGAASKASRRAT